MASLPNYMHDEEQAVNHIEAPLSHSEVVGARGAERAVEVSPVVLALCNAYLPGFRCGGPARSLANLVERLGDELDFRIVCPDRDQGDTQRYAGIRASEWNAVGKARVYYLPPNRASVLALRRLLRSTPHDVLYLNSFFHPTYTLRPLLLRALRQIPRKPLIVAPRGEFSPGALRIKPRRKAAFVAFARWTGMYAEAQWQASTPREADEIQRRFRVTRNPIQVARNLVAEIPDTRMQPRSNDTLARSAGPWSLRVCFLSRISRMKNLDFALRVLAHVGVPVVFDIYGPLEDAAYWGQCQELIATLPSHVSVQHFGAVESAQVRATIAQYDLFFVPTRGENFGHVFVEAWSAGVPVLTSDCTPWRGLHEKGIGFDLPLSDSKPYARAIEAVGHLDAAHYEAMCQRCLAFAREQAENPAVVDANRRLFLDAIQAGKTGVRRHQNG